MNYIIFLFLFLLLIIVYNCLIYKKTEGFGGSSSLPSVISADSFGQYFMVDHGIANCGNGSGCPDNAQDYITGPGIIEWKGGKSATFRTKNAVLPSGYGFVGVKFNSVPTGGSGLWNSIWLMGKDNNGSNTSGSLLEVDIYENNTGWGWAAPKLSFHDWQSGHGTKVADGSDGCFGVYLNGDIGDGNCGQKYGKIIKNWDWNSAQSKIYNGATWYTLITKHNDKPLVYTGISLKGWLPQSKGEATYNNVLQNSDFLISSGDGNIDGNPAGGYYFCITSTATSPPPDGSKYDIPVMVNYDGVSSGGTPTPPKPTPPTPTPPKPTPPKPTPPKPTPPKPTPPKPTPRINQNLQNQHLQNQHLQNQHLLHLINQNLQRLQNRQHLQPLHQIQNHQIQNLLLEKVIIAI